MYLTSFASIDFSQVESEATPGSGRVHLLLAPAAPLPSLVILPLRLPVQPAPRSQPDIGGRGGGHLALPRLTPSHRRPLAVQPESAKVEMRTPSYSEETKLKSSEHCVVKIWSARWQIVSSHLCHNLISFSSAAVSQLITILSELIITTRSDLIVNQYVVSSAWIGHISPRLHLAVNIGENMTPSFDQEWYTFQYSQNAPFSKESFTFFQHSCIRSCNWKCAVQPSFVFFQ